MQEAEEIDRVVCGVLGAHTGVSATRVRGFVKNIFSSVAEEACA